MIWRLPRPGRAVVFCAGPDDAYDVSLIEVPVGDLSHTGLALTILRARADDDHGLEDAVWSSYGDDEITRSSVELALLMAAVANNLTIDFSEAVPIAVQDTVNHIAGVAHHHRQVSWLLTIAQRVEAVADAHHAACPACRGLRDESPLLIRARFVRDLADGLALGSEEPFTLNGVPALAAADACWFLMQVTEYELDVSHQTQLDALGEALLDAVTGLSGVGDGTN